MSESQSCMAVYGSGVRGVLTQLQSQLWTTKARPVVKRVIRGCVTCRKLEGLWFKSPPPSFLPEVRAKEERTFKYTGINYCGLVYIETGDTTEKGYTALMTCAATRMTHLELVMDLSAQSLLKRLKRFIGRREMAKLMISDNRKSFKAPHLNNFIIKNELFLQRLDGGVDYLRG